MELGGQWGFIHFEACLPALAVPGNTGWWIGIRIHFWGAREPSTGNDLPLDRELSVPDGLSGNGCAGIRLMSHKNDEKII